MGRHELSLDITSSKDSPRTLRLANSASAAGPTTADPDRNRSSTVSIGRRRAIDDELPSRETRIRLKGIIQTRLPEYPELAADRVFKETQDAGCSGSYT